MWIMKIKIYIKCRYLCPYLIKEILVLRGLNDIKEIKKLNTLGIKPNVLSETEDNAIIKLENNLANKDKSFETRLL